MSLAIEVAYSQSARDVQLLLLTVPDGSTVGAALDAAGLAELVAVRGLAVGVWGRRCGLDHALRDGDRVEVYRALRVDPKEARRLRYRGQRATKAKRSAPAGR
jgi:putative ubiquitin-RnfH superfamily antitoxin RatB of RatAB toxin-antitoxin module